MDSEESLSKKLTSAKEIYHIKGGMVEREDGTLEKTKMFDFLDIPFNPISISQCLLVLYRDNRDSPGV